MALDYKRSETQETNSETLLLELVNHIRLLVATNDIQKERIAKLESRSNELLWEFVNMTRILAATNGIKDEQIAALQLQVAQQSEALHTYQQQATLGTESTQLQWQWGQAKLPPAASYLPVDKLEQKVEKKSFSNN